jgi:hypothetical protein
LKDCLAKNNVFVYVLKDCLAKINNSEKVIAFSEVMQALCPCITLSLKKQKEQPDSATRSGKTRFPLGLN